MSTVIFVPGLRGHRALAQDFNTPAGQNESAVSVAALDQGHEYQRLDYQSSLVQNPTLARMELRVLAQLKKVIADANGEPVVAVGSSVGFGVLLGALSRLKSSTSPIGLIGFKPLPDPLLAIQLQINNTHALEAIQAGKLTIDMPVESTGGLQDTFSLSAKHLNDRQALRVLSRPSDSVAFNEATDNLRIYEMAMIYGADDHLTPSAHIKAFRDSVHSVQAELVALKGNHSADFSDALYAQTCQMIAKLG